MFYGKPVVYVDIHTEMTQATTACSNSLSSNTRLNNLHLQQWFVKQDSTELVHNVFDHSYNPCPYTDIVELLRSNLLRHEAT